MKKLLLAVVVTVFGFNTHAQNDPDSYVEVMRSVLSTEKKAAIADIMVFSQEQSQAFWPLYNELQEKLYDINTKRYNLINKFAENFGKMEDAKATELMNNYMDTEIAELNLRKSYYPKFVKAIGGKKALRYYQAENKIRVMVDYELAASIPLFEE